MEHCDHGSLHIAVQRGIFKPSSKWGAKLALRALIRTAREVAQVRRGPHEAGAQKNRGGA